MRRLGLQQAIQYQACGGVCESRDGGMQAVKGCRVIPNSVVQTQSGGWRDILAFEYFGVFSDVAVEEESK